MTNRTNKFILGFALLFFPTILSLGYGMEQFGITRPYDLQYQALAKKWNLAILETALHGKRGQGPPVVTSRGGQRRYAGKSLLGNRAEHFS